MRQGSAFNIVWALWHLASAGAHTDIRGGATWLFPAKPADDDLLGEDLTEAEHDAVNERQEHVDCEAREHREHPRLRAQS